ncbi:MAG: hypothetical protein R2877_06195 [Bdellovibrionota bacterium]
MSHVCWVCQSNSFFKNWKSNIVLTETKTEKSKIPYHSMMGVGLYYGVIGFMLSICWWIDERALLIANAFMFLLPTILLIVRFRDPLCSRNSRITLESIAKISSMT